MRVYLDVERKNDETENFERVQMSNYRRFKR